MVYARVNKIKSEAMLAAKHVDTAAATGKVYHLLPCNIARRHAYVLAFNAMVTAEKNMALARELWRQCLLYKANLNCQTFESSKRALGLVQIVDFFIISSFIPLSGAFISKFFIII